MKSALKNIANALFGDRLTPIRKARAMSAHKRGICSYGQEGEDRVISSLLFKLHGGVLPKTGFYIDIGAHHPYLYSNTFLFYRLGWSGLNIDAAPGSMANFRAHRPRDINVEVGVGRAHSTASFYVFNEPALSTFDERLAREREIAPRRIRDVVAVEIAPAADIFARHIKPDQLIDFLTIDVEGLDLEVLQSNDWQQYRPMIVAVEIYDKTIAECLNNYVATFLSENNYTFYSKTVNTALFIDADVLRIL